MYLESQQNRDEAESIGTGDISYRDISQLSEVTDDVFRGDSKVGDGELNDFNRLKNQTQKKLHILSEEDDVEDGDSQASQERSDEFLRNFFIKFGMRKTLESFQQEWCELKANDGIDVGKLLEIPQIYRKNAELSDELQVLQQELDEARIIAEKARSTYDKLRKQRDFQKINHRRVQ